jgi:hypothetical protein
MSLPDLINGAFEGFGSFFLLLHCLRLRKDKLVRGVSITATAFFFCWGLWNLFYYYHLEQIFSWYAGMAVVLVNGLYVAMLIYYRNNERKFC